MQIIFHLLMYKTKLILLQCGIKMVKYTILYWYSYLWTYNLHGHVHNAFYVLLPYIIYVMPSGRFSHCPAFR